MSHRLPIALAARAIGSSVSVISGQPGSLIMEAHADHVLEKLNIPFKKLIFRSAGINPVIEFIGLIQLILRLKKNRPNVLHCVSPKGVLYGGIAARLMSIDSLVLAISGMGFIFTESRSNIFLRKFIAAIYKNIFLYVLRHKNIHIIVQNKDDYEFFLSNNLCHSKNLTLIQGSGVDLERFIYFPIEKKDPIVILPARMMIDKGVLDFAVAVTLIKRMVPDWKFILVGAADYKNPNTVSGELIKSWQDNRILDWLGHVEDIAPLLAKASIVCLPSYREGMPKALLEAAAAGCAIITTDVVGCRDAIVPGKTGDLVPVASPEALAESLYSLINDFERRQGYGIQGRKLAIEKYSIKSVILQTLSVYEGLTADGK